LTESNSLLFNHGMAQDGATPDFSHAVTPEGVDPFTAMGIGENGEDLNNPPSNGSTPAQEPTQGADPYNQPLEDPQAEPEPPKRGRPRKDNPAPGSDGQGSVPPGQGQGNEVTPQDFGFDSWEDAGKHLAASEDVAGAINDNLKKSYDNMRPEYTRMTQELSEMRENYGRLLGYVEQLQRGYSQPPPQQPQQPQLSKEELTELWHTDPERASIEFLKSSGILSDLIRETPEWQEVNSVRNEFGSNQVVHSLRQKPDFPKYEPQILDFLNEQGEYASYYADPEGRIVETLYENMRMKDQLRTLFEKLGRSRAADMTVRADNRGKTNLGSGALNPQPANPGNGLKEVGRYQIPAADTEFLYGSRGSRLIRGRGSRRR